MEIKNIFCHQIAPYIKLWNFNLLSRVKRRKHAILNSKRKYLADVLIFITPKNFQGQKFFQKDERNGSPYLVTVKKLNKSKQGI